jgi:antitoxin CptB
MEMRHPRLYWQCRRGMRELDLLLQSFLERAYDELDEREQAGFERLLAYPDALLFEYLMGCAAPSDPLIARVVEKIRDAATA